MIFIAAIATVALSNFFKYFYILVYIEKGLKISGFIIKIFLI